LIFLNAKLIIFDKNDFVEVKTIPLENGYMRRNFILIDKYLFVTGKEKEVLKYDIDNNFVKLDLI
jgi:hypothetical protein